MSKYCGDYSKNDTIYFTFTTFRPSTGAPFTLAGTPVVSVYKDNNTTQDTAGVTLTVDFDTVTGLNLVTVATTTAFYVDGSSYECVITTGTVDSVSVVGACVGRFTLRDQAHIYPTVAGRTLDVSATGEAGIDWANVGSPTTTVGLTGTTIATSQQITSVSGSVGSVTGAVGSVTGSVGSISTAGMTSLADTVLSRKLNMLGSISDVSVTSISSATFTGNNTYIAGDMVQFITTAPASFATNTKYYVISTSLSSTTFQLSATLGGSAITTASTGAFTVTPIDDRTVRSALRYLRNKVAISSVTMTTYLEDDVATAWTSTITGSPGVDPVVTSDPA